MCVMLLLIKDFLQLVMPVCMKQLTVNHTFFLSAFFPFSLGNSSVCRDGKSSSITRLANTCSNTHIHTLSLRNWTKIVSVLKIKPYPIPFKKRFLKGFTLNTDTFNCTCLQSVWKTNVIFIMNKQTVPNSGNLHLQYAHTRPVCQSDQT